VWEGDELPEVELDGGRRLPKTVLDLSGMELGLSEDGSPSWLDRTTHLRDRDDLGPFRLGYLEALLRVADWRGSAEGDLRRAGRLDP
jgi:CRISPR-associated endonuclease/helicase Cas3